MVSNMMLYADDIWQNTYESRFSLDSKEN